MRMFFFGESTFVATNVTALIVKSDPPAVMRTDNLVTTSDFVRITMSTITPEDATMTPHNDMIPATTAAITPSKEIPPPVAFFMAELGILMIR